MGEISSNMTTAVIMVHLTCHEDAYLHRKTKSVQLSKKAYTLLKKISQQTVRVLGKKKNQHKTTTETSIPIIAFVL